MSKEPSAENDATAKTDQASLDQNGTSSSDQQPTVSPARVKINTTQILTQDAAPKSVKENKVEKKD